jgi:hypothetical protein
LLTGKWRVIIIGRKRQKNSTVVATSACSLNCATVSSFARVGLQQFDIPHFYLSIKIRKSTVGKVKLLSVSKRKE